MPQLDFSWWISNLLINWTLWATTFLVIVTWSNSEPLQTKIEEK